MLITVTCGGEMERHGYEKGVFCMWKMVCWGREVACVDVS